MRKRMIDSDINRSRSLAKVSIGAELAFILLWRSLDDYGYVVYNAEDLLFESFGRRDDIDPSTYEGWLNELLAVGCLSAFKKDEHTYLYAPKWDIYQTINRPSKRKTPAYEANKCELVGVLTEYSLSSRELATSLSTHGVLTEHSRERKKEGRKEGRDVRDSKSLPGVGAPGSDPSAHPSSTEGAKRFGWLREIMGGVSDDDGS